MVLTRALSLRMQAQPDDRSCGPTCLQAVYDYYGRHERLDELIAGIPQLESGGTLAVQLGCDALRRGFVATIYTYNLQLFDPTWFLQATDVAARLREQAERKPDDGRLRVATERYLEFLAVGGTIRDDVLSPRLIAGFLGAGTPILTGLSATYLHETAREIPETDRPDDILGVPTGHFVVLCGYDETEETITVADPWPMVGHPDQTYVRPLHRVIAAILLGVLTYDANLLIIEPRP